VLACAAAPQQTLAEGLEGLKPKEPICLIGCRQDLRACLATVRSELSSCFGGCRDEAEVVRTACTGAVESPACAAARRAAADCLEPCRSVLGDRVRVCLGSGKECARTCPEAHDIDCVRDCAGGRARCVEGALIQLRLCEVDACSAEYEAARQACLADEEVSPGEECIAAREALEPCLDACDEAFRESSEACNARLRGCLAGCATI
jgi:hypothetical protein